jgi:hypothetical protein
VPSITLLEVCKRICLQRDEITALQYVAVMQQGRVVELDAALALRASMLGLRCKLPLADSPPGAASNANTDSRIRIRVMKNSGGLDERPSELCASSRATPKRASHHKLVAPTAIVPHTPRLLRIRKGEANSCCSIPSRSSCFWGWC